MVCGQPLCDLHDCNKHTTSGANAYENHLRRKLESFLMLRQQHYHV
jgi:hypothetical protein